MHIYRTHHCAELRLEDQSKKIRLSGWIHRKRDHGNLLFIDVRDHYGITQCVAETGDAYFTLLEEITLESVVSITGELVPRSKETINEDLPTGEVEVKIGLVKILSKAEALPMPVNQEAGYPEDIRLRYRYLDLRREKLHNHIMLRSRVITAFRQEMHKAGFHEFQTPILTATSPEGARDFLVSSRLHPGKFYALPQAPQQFKQLLMIAGFDRYFQIAPCFRDEDARADRSPGEFYQLDFEMSFVTQEDVFATIEPVIASVFNQFKGSKTVTKTPFPCIPYDQAMMLYGSDKPDLRNPLRISDISDILRGSSFKVFSSQIEQGGVLRAIPVPGAASRPRAFFDTLNDWAREEGQKGLGYIAFKPKGPAGPIARNLESDRLEKIKEKLHLNEGDAVFFACGPEKQIAPFSGLVRTKLGQDLEMINDSRFDFCWITEYPMYEYDEKTQSIAFSHNPFSMPVGGMEALETQNPLDIKALQYDIVCNGVELSSGAIRNHLPDLMVKAFAIAGYGEEEVEKRFGGMLSALKHGAPPHGGAAPGIDRIVMLLAEEANIREITAFPMNQMAQDLMMGAPCVVDKKQLEDIHIRLSLPPEQNDKSSSA